MRRRDPRPERVSFSGGVSRGRGELVFEASVCLGAGRALGGSGLGERGGGTGLRDAHGVVCGEGCAVAFPVLFEAFHGSLRKCI